MRKLTSTERAILEQCVGDNSMGRVGWPLRVWESDARRACDPLIDLGLLIERRLGGYPGVQITEAGRTALSSLKGGE
jgi:hypothetical protein